MHPSSLNTESDINLPTYGKRSDYTITPPLPHPNFSNTNSYPTPHFHPLSVLQPSPFHKLTVHPFSHLSIFVNQTTFAGSYAKNSFMTINTCLPKNLSTPELLFRTSFLPLKLELRCLPSHSMSWYLYMMWILNALHMWFFLQKPIYLTPQVKLLAFRINPQNPYFLLHTGFECSREGVSTWLLCRLPHYHLWHVDWQ